jgi:hypothetical protein
MSAVAGHIFGIVMPDEDETPDARAFTALRTELLARFPEHHFVFIERSEMPDEDDLRVFRVFAAGIMDDIDNEVSGPMAGPELVAEMQSAVDEIVRAARLRSIN